MIVISITKLVIEMFNVIFSICQKTFNEFLVLMSHHYFTQI